MTLSLIREKAQLGLENTEIISKPGTGWPDENPEHINEFAAKIKAAYDFLRLRGFHTNQRMRLD